MAMEWFGEQIHAQENWIEWQVESSLRDTNKELSGLKDIILKESKLYATIGEKDETIEITDTHAANILSAAIQNADTFQAIYAKNSAWVVFAVQKLLTSLASKDKNYADIVASEFRIDGLFGDQTQSLIRAFQEKWNQNNPDHIITVDGYAGKETIGKLLQASNIALPVAEQETPDIYPVLDSYKNYTGKGKYTYSNGDVYEGDRVDGKETGKGKCTWADGSVYEGDFVDDKRAGKGKYTYSNGSVYEGDFVDDKRTGKGKYTLADGSVYEGDRVDGKTTGKGKYTNPHGEVFEWQREDDQYISNGKRYTMEQLDNKKEPINNPSVSLQEALKSSDKLKTGIVVEYKKYRLEGRKKVEYPTQIDLSEAFVLLFTEWKSEDVILDYYNKHKEYIRWNSTLNAYLLYKSMKWLGTKEKIIEQVVANTIDDMTNIYNTFGKIEWEDLIDWLIGEFWSTWASPSDRKYFEKMIVSIGDKNPALQKIIADKKEFSSIYHTISGRKDWEWKQNI